MIDVPAGFDGESVIIDLRPMFVAPRFGPTTFGKAKYHLYIIELAKVPNINSQRLIPADDLGRYKEMVAHNYDRWWSEGRGRGQWVGPEDYRNLDKYVPPIYGEAQ